MPELPFARPVAYILVSHTPDPRTGEPRMRTRLEWGIVNNEFRANIMAKSPWRIGGIIGHFENMDQAKGFVTEWRGGQNGPPTRGPSQRMSAGIALAAAYGVECWIDFPQVFGLRLVHHGVSLMNGSVMAYDLTQALGQVNA